MTDSVIDRINKDLGVQERIEACIEPCPYQNSARAIFFGRVLYDIKLRVDHMEGDPPELIGGGPKDSGWRCNMGTARAWGNVNQYSTWIDKEKRNRFTHAHVNGRKQAEKKARELLDDYCQTHESIMVVDSRLIWKQP